MNGPKEFTSTTRRVKTGCGNMYCTLMFDQPDENGDGGGKFVGMLAKLGRAGGCSSLTIEVISTLVTEGLRAGADAKRLAHCLKGVQCHQANPMAGIMSCADAVASAIERALELEAQNTTAAPRVHPQNRPQ